MESLSDWRLSVLFGSLDALVDAFGLLVRIKRFSQFVNLLSEAETHILDGWKKTGTLHYFTQNWTKAGEVYCTN